MATMYPTNLAELERCQGVSKGKALKFGRPFVDLIAKYVEENDIEKPDDFVMKSVANRSNNKIYIIQNIDKKIPLATIARNKDLRLDGLLEEMETIVASGTRLNLDYAIDDMNLDDDDKDEIIDYFKNCQDSSLQVAQEELSDSGYNWEQLKIMRIKFLSEYGKLILIKEVKMREDDSKAMSSSFLFVHVGDRGFNLIDIKTLLLRRVLYFFLTTSLLLLPRLVI
jgi:ATP-dependent DNA helicase RecQ